MSIFRYFAKFWKHAYVDDLLWRNYKPGKIAMLQVSRLILTHKNFELKFSVLVFSKRFEDRSESSDYFWYQIVINLWFLINWNDFILFVFRCSKHVVQFNSFKTFQARYYFGGQMKWKSMFNRFLKFSTFPYSVKFYILRGHLVWKTLGKQNSF